MAIGGMTVGELEARMSYAEFQRWGAYVKENGPLNPMLRMDAAIARALMPFLKRGTTMKDLMPWPVEPEQEGTPEDVAKLLMKMSDGNKKGRKARYRRA